MFKKSDQENIELVFHNLIEQMPDNMEILLDKLYTKSTKTYDFSLIDQPINKTITNHPLYQIAESNDERLLTHHTTQKLMELKFKHLPRMAFLTDVVLYILYALAVSFYHLVYELNTNDYYISNKTSTTKIPNSFSNNNNKNNETIYFLFDIDIRISIHTYNLIYSILILLITIHMSKETFQMINYTPLDYFSSVDNWFQLSTLFLAIASILPFIERSYQIAFGSFSILFAWISMSLFFQDLTIFGLGRYIVAFRKTIQNSFKFMPFFSMICIGFFFAFKIGEKFNIQQYYADNKSIAMNPWSSFLRVITMMMGDLDLPDYDPIPKKFIDLFGLKNVYNAIIFLFFVFLMCIIILSLFEGIAVGEIKIVLDKAHNEIIASTIVYVLNIQMIAYYMYRLMFRNKREPNFMTFKTVYTKKELKTKKKSTESIKNVNNNCNIMLIRLNNLGRKLDEQINQIKMVRKSLTKYRK